MIYYHAMTANLPYMTCTCISAPMQMQVRVRVLVLVLAHEHLLRNMEYQGLHTVSSISDIQDSIILRSLGIRTELGLSSRRHLHVWCDVCP